MDALRDVVDVPGIDAGEIDAAVLRDVDVLLLDQELHLLVWDSHRTHNSSQAQAELEDKKCQYQWGPRTLSLKQPHFPKDVKKAQSGVAN